MRTAPALVLLCVSPAVAELIPHTANLNVLWEFSGQPPQTGTSVFTSTAEVLTVPTPSPETVEYQYPSGLIFLTIVPGSFLTFSPIGGVGQHVPVAPFHWQNTLTSTVTYTIDFSLVLSSSTQAEWRSETPQTAYLQSATWTLMNDVRLTLGGGPTTLPALTIFAGSTLVTIPGPGAVPLLLLGVLAARRRR
jgi:hypothetical protein